MSFVMSRISAFCKETKLGLETGGIVFRFMAGKDTFTLFKWSISPVDTNTVPSRYPFWLKQQLCEANHSLSSSSCVYNEKSYFSNYG